MDVLATVRTVSSREAIVEATVDSPHAGRYFHLQERQGMYSADTVLICVGRCKSAGGIIRPC